MNTIGENIKRIRLNKKMTQEKLSEHLNVSVSAVSQWESGKTMPDISQLPLLCDLLETTSDDLLGIHVFQKGQIIDAAIKDSEELVHSQDYTKAIDLLLDRMKKYPKEETLEAAYITALVAYWEDKTIDDNEKSKYVIDFKDSHASCISAVDDAMRPRAMRCVFGAITYECSVNCKSKYANVKQLISDGKTDDACKALRKEIDDQKEVFGADDRLLSYTMMESLMELLLKKSAADSCTPAERAEHLAEALDYGNRFLSANPDVTQYFNILSMLYDVGLQTGDSDTVKKCSDTLDGVRKCLQKLPDPLKQGSASSK